VRLARCCHLIGANTRMTPTRRVARGGGCGCMPQGGGYRATAKNRKMLRRYRAGQSIGFTGVASLKAKGLLARTSKKNRGKKIVGPKYR
jgi:hypothetical protein